MQDLIEKTLTTECKYTGKIISVDLLDIELPDGRKAKREVICHGNAVTILARCPNGKIVFVNDRLSVSDLRVNDAQRPRRNGMMLSYCQERYDLSTGLNISSLRETAVKCGLEKDL